MEKILLISMIVVAFISINTKTLKNSVIYLAVFSVLGSFLFLIYNAPDVAIAEAVMAAAFSTVIFLVAIKKHKLIVIYLVGTEKDFSQVRKDLDNFLQSRELEPEFRIANIASDEFIKNGNCDYIVWFDDLCHVLSVKDNVYFNQMKTFFDKKSYHRKKVKVYRYE